MDIYYVREIVLLVALAIPVISGLFYFKGMDRPTSLFYFLVLFTLIKELLAVCWVITWRTNLAVYNIGCLGEFLLTCLYFNEAVPLLKRNDAGIWIGIAGVAAGIADLAFIEPLNSIPAYLLSGQYIITTLLSMLCLTTFLRPGDERVLLKDVHFLLPVILFFSSGFAYVFHVLLSYYTLASRPVPQFVIWSMYLVDVAGYFGIAAVYIRLPKMENYAGR